MNGMPAIWMLLALTSLIHFLAMVFFQAWKSHARQLRLRIIASL